MNEIYINKMYTIRLGRFDAYDEEVVNKHFVNKVKFDFMLDDGPHTLESMQKFISLYHPLMTEDGILIIEDVQSWDWIEVYDLRRNKERYDDIVFTIDKS